jgi:hypothetical protein
MQPTPVAAKVSITETVTDTMTYSDSEGSDLDVTEETKGTDPSADARTISIDSIVDNSLLRQSMTMYESKIEQQKETRQTAN